MASGVEFRRRYERRRAVDDVLTAQRIACQAGNETLAKMLEAALVAGLDGRPNDRRDPVMRSRLVAVAMNHFDHTFKSKPR